MTELFGELIFAFGETFTMVCISTLCAVIFGLPLGIAIYVTDRHLFWQNRFTI